MAKTQAVQQAYDDKIEFLNKNKDVALVAFRFGYKCASAKLLINRARKQLKYSPKTISSDIFKFLQHAYLKVYGAV
jgi:hypothetical protein